MTDLEFRHLGIFQTLITEYESHRLPRLFRLKESVDSDHQLTDVDLDFLSYIIEDTCRTIAITAEDPPMHDFCVLLMHLYHDITARALANEELNAQLIVH